MRSVAFGLLLVGGCLTTAETVDTASAGEPGPPEVWDLGTGQLRATEGDTVVFTAFVQDPDGDLIEVWLEGGAGERYGELVADGSGRHVLSLTWGQIHAVSSIEFEGEEERRFVARAVDALGQEGEADTVLTLACMAISPAACDGKCIDLDVEACP